MSIIPPRWYRPTLLAHGLVLTRKVRTTGAPSYLSQHLVQHVKHDPRRFHY